MDKTPEDILMQILEIIDYQDDRAEFVKDFISICRKKAFVILINGLSEQDQQKFKQLDPTDESSQVTFFKQYLTQDMYDQALSKATEKFMRDYIEHLIPHITAEQKEQLFVFMKSVAHEA